jgi:type IV pilus assembly protein PilE
MKGLWKLMRRANRGFTLIEVMIVVVVVAILTSIAVPSYTQHVRRAAVEEATAALSSARITFEQYFLDNRTYGGAPCPAGTSRFAFTCNTPVPVTPNVTTYTVTATGTGAVANFVYTINERNQRTSTTPWGSNNPPDNCWIDRAGGSC